MSDSGGCKRIETVSAAVFCLLAILGLIAIIYAVGLLNGEQSERRQNNPHSYSETAKQEAERACIGADPKAVFECVVSYVEASEDTAYTEQDLTAQQRAAWGALIAAFAGLASVGVSFVGLYWIKGTLDATRVAANQATIATDAMVRQNQLAEAVQRPWLRAEIKPLSIKPEDNGDVEIWFELTISNEGQSLAKNIVVSRHSVQQPSENGVAIEIGQHAAINELSSTLPPRGSDVVRAFTTLPKPKFFNAMNGYRAIIVVEICYEGGFTRETCLVGEMKNGIDSCPWEIRKGKTLFNSSIASAPYRDRKYK